MKKLNKIVSRNQIPFKYRAERPKSVQWVARWFPKIMWLESRRQDSTCKRQ
jgi:hypothetical protein